MSPSSAAQEDDTESTSLRVTRLGIRGDPRVAELALPALRGVAGVQDVSISLGCATILGSRVDEDRLIAAVG